MTMFVVRYPDAATGLMAERSFTALDAAQRFARERGGLIHRRRT